MMGDVVTPVSVYMKLAGILESVLMNFDRVPCDSHDDVGRTRV